MSGGVAVLLLAAVVSVLTTSAVLFLWGSLLMREKADDEPSTNERRSDVGLQPAASSLRRNDGMSVVQGSLGSVSPPALPSEIVAASKKTNAKRGRVDYGGSTDKQHLGGFLHGGDQGSLSNNTFNWMLSELTIKSIIDLGCGRGYSSSYFLSMGADVLCIEGSHEAVQASLLPPSRVIEHDFTRGVFFPDDRTYDAVWCTEFVEHVGRQYMGNYLPVFRRAALIFVSYGSYGGWHHVEVRDEWWWKAKFTAAGFVFSAEITSRLQRYAAVDNRLAVSSKTGKLKATGYIVHSTLVFINPAVAQLVEHSHIFGGDGCIWADTKNVPCSKTHRWFNPDVDIVPERFQSLLDCKLPDKKINATAEKDLWICTKRSKDKRASSSEGRDNPSPRQVRALDEQWT